MCRGNHFPPFFAKKNAKKKRLVVDIEEGTIVGGKKGRIFITPPYD
jgi:hypothetical protein